MTIKNDYGRKRPSSDLFRRSNPGEWATLNYRNKSGNGCRNYKNHSLTGRAKPLILWTLTLLTAWIAIMALVMRYSDAAPAAVVILPGERFIAAMPDAAILSRSPVSITLKSDAPAFAKSLYGAGAWLVLPAGLTGCLPLPAQFR